MQRKPMQTRCLKHMTTVQESFSPFSNLIGYQFDLNPGRLFSNTVIRYELYFYFPAKSKLNIQIFVYVLNEYSNKKNPHSSSH